jgi:hypothetical protein
LLGPLAVPSLCSASFIVRILVLSLQALHAIRLFDEVAQFDG